MLKSNNTALVLCGHGSSFGSYEQDFKKNHRLFEKKIHTNCYYCFIEKNQPNIENCLKDIKKKGVKTVFFFPFLLFNGEHFEKDIKAKIKELSENLKLEIKLIDKISLTNDVMPIVKKKISQILKPNKTNIFVTFCSKSKNSKVISELKIYTQKLAENLNIAFAYSFFVGEEAEFLKKIKNHEREGYFLIVQPIFLFKGYLQNKNLDFFSQLNSNSHQVSSTLMGISDIQALVIKKARKYF